jgi:hypothetical protein
MEELISLEYVAIQAKNSFIELHKKVWANGLKYKKIYGNDDIRGDFYIVFSELLLWLIIQLENFHEKYPQQKIGNYMSLEKRSRTQMILQFDTINRQSFITIAMFNIEIFIVALATGLKLKPRSNNYKDTVESLSENLFPLEAKETFRLLYSPYLIRNSLHNNGYIKQLKEDFEISIGGKKFIFKKDTKVTLGGWDNLYILIDGLLDILIQIMEHDKLKSVNKILHNNETELDTQVRYPNHSKNDTH